MFPIQTVAAFDSFLVSLGLRFEAVAVGGSALALLGVTNRQTRDLDILDPLLPEEISEAARGFARQLRDTGLSLADDWLNNGPSQLKDVLPPGWEARLQVVFQGQALLLKALGRSDLLKTKLFALCDRGTDLVDCVALGPTSQELEEALPWLVVQDAHPDWPAHVAAVLDDLGGRLVHGVQ
jgi:hypothetical protein